MGVNSGRPGPTSSEKKNSPSSLPSLRWSRRLASSRKGEFSSFFFESPVMDYQEIIAGTVGRENTYGTIVGKVKAGPMSFAHDMIEGVSVRKSKAFGRVMSRSQAMSVTMFAQT